MHACVHREACSCVAMFRSTPGGVPLYAEGARVISLVGCVVSLVSRSHGVFVVTEPNPVLCSFSLSPAMCDTVLYFAMSHCSCLFGCRGWGSRTLSAWVRVVGLVLGGSVLLAWAHAAGQRSSGVQAFIS